jgi:hypothetical protein
MQIDFTFDQSVNSLPTGMVEALDVAASYLDHLFANPITINIEIGYGEITQDGQSSTVSSGAEGGPDDDAYWSLAQTTQILAGDVTSLDQRLGLSNILSLAGLSLDSIDMSSAQQKALGQLSGADSATDGSVGFQINGAGGITYDFNPFQRGVGQEWDFIGVALHEMTHALGRLSDLGQGSTLALIDLYRYRAPGQLQTNETGSPAYFSLDGGVTHLENFDTTGSDPADWLQGGPNDANNAISNVGVANDFAQVDLRELNALGFERKAQTDDFEGKGTSDIIWQNTATGAITEWQFANGARTGTVSLGSAPGYEIVGTGDFNRDGTTDLLWMNPTTGDVWGWLMSNGAESQAIHYGNLLGSTATVGDFGGNDVADIVWENTATGATSDWLMGGGQHYASDYLGAKPGWTFIGAGDFSGNGTSDLVLERTTGAVWDWMMTKGVHTSSNPLANMSNYTYLGSGDFNGDGVTDLLWRNNVSNHIQEWLMSNGSIGSKVDLGVFGGASVVATGDYWGTGTSDIVWQNTTTGATTIWAMLNGQHQSAYDVNLGVTSGLKGI